MNSRNVLGLMVLAFLAACGGGGGAATPSSSTPAQPVVDAPPPAVPSTPSTIDADLALASRLYKGDERTPAGFDVEARPSNVTGTLSTRHIRNTDLATGPQAISPTYELCTNDMAQAMDWSERQATWNGQYSDMAEVNADSHMFEIVRVPRADPTALLRHRVFRCDYLDRSGTDLRADAGDAGDMNQRPLTSDELESLTEYLWQFTIFNNADYAVQSSMRSATGAMLVQTIRMGELIRGASGSCDTVQIVDWTHTMSSTDGSLTRTVSNVRSFQVKNELSGVASCTG
jgi:hypothetical protein